MLWAADLIPLDTATRRLACRVPLVAAIAAAVLVTDPSRVAGQEHVFDVVVGIAATGTSAEQQTLAVAGGQAVTPRFFFHDGWNVRGVGDAAWRPLFTMRETTPEYREGLSVAGGLRLARTTARLETALAMRVGSTHVADNAGTNGAGNWAAFFEGGVDFRWLGPLVDVYAGLRHDNRLQRAGALSIYRDPTGRALVNVSVLPFRLGPLAAGVAFESETALPGAGRLPSGVTISALFRY
jgi:hypothetical protein